MVVELAVKSISQGPRCIQLAVPHIAPSIVLISLLFATTLATGHQQHYSTSSATKLNERQHNSSNHRQPSTKTTALPPRLSELELDSEHQQEGSSVNKGIPDGRNKRDNVPEASTTEITGDDVDFMANLSDVTDVATEATPASNDPRNKSKTVANIDGQQQFYNKSNQAITHQEMQMDPEDMATNVGQTDGLDDRLAAIGLHKQQPGAANDFTVAHEIDTDSDNQPAQRVTHQRQVARRVINRDHDAQNNIAPQLTGDRQVQDQDQQRQQYHGTNGVVYNDDAGDEERNLMKIYEDELIQNLYNRQPVMVGSNSGNNSNNQQQLYNHQQLHYQTRPQNDHMGGTLRNKQTPGKPGATKARLALPQSYQQVASLLPPYTVMKGLNQDIGPVYQTLQDVGNIFMPQQQQQHYLHQNQLASSPKPLRNKITKKRYQIVDDKQHNQTPLVGLEQPLVVATKKSRGANLFRASGSRQHPTIAHEDQLRMGQNQQLSLIPLQMGSNSQILGIIGALPAPQLSVTAPAGSPPTVNPNGYSNARQPIRIGQIAHSDYLNNNNNKNTPSNNNNQQALESDGYSRYLYSPRSQYSGNRNSYQPNAHFNRIGANFLHRTGFVTSPATGPGPGSASSGYQSDDNPPGAQASSVSSSTSEPMWSDSRHQEDDYQQSPQTIQITAVPNGLGLNNGFMNNGWNGGWNGVNGGWNGRQVLLVNRQPQLASQWRDWMLPVAIVLALPLVLGALFLPVMLKSVMFLIQILQMLGLLMPPSQLAGHIASASHNGPAG